MLSYTLYNTVITKIEGKKPNRSKSENDWQFYGSFFPPSLYPIWLENPAEFSEGQFRRWADPKPCDG